MSSEDDLNNIIADLELVEETQENSSALRNALYLLRGLVP